MIGLVILSCLLALSTAQYPYSHNSGAYQPQQYQPQQGSSGAYQPQQYQPQQGSPAGSTAPVHYVSIGPQLQGDYKFGYNTGNGGSFREETRNPDGSVAGAYGYIDANGQQKVIRYTAGKDGFKAEGDDIPKPPPAPKPAAPQPAPYQPQAASYPQQPAASYPQRPAYQPQQSYFPPPVHSVNNNYIQPQPAHAYSQYAAPQQYNNAGRQQSSYNPFAYISNPAAAQVNPLSQLSYNIGGGNPNRYQG